MRLGKRPKAKHAQKEIEANAGRIDPQHGLIPVIQATCARGARFTITAEAGDQRYVILVDRGGPFNVTGPGVTGSVALAGAVHLREGIYQVEHGWPMAQPLFQIGLDTTLQDLSMSGPAARGPVLPPPLPKARGVPARPTPSATTNPMPAGAPAASPAPVPALAPAALAVPAAPAMPTAPITPAMPAAPAPVPPVLNAFPSPPPPVQVDPVAPPPQTQLPVMDRLIPPQLPVEPARPAPIIPGLPGTSQKQGSIKHYLTQALLWVVQVDEPDCYTLGQAWRLSRQAVQVGVSELLLSWRDFWQHEVGNRWRGIRREWKKSGEVARKRTGQRR
jgi:hypothetical protein